ncbi:MAG: hypothetical protein JWM57_1256 [Phycisphaerales bacterium]|nr:hypothetical protein [Phycisphaerales bacterium]
MSHLSAARAAIAQEISFLKREQARLHSVLEQLGSGGDAASVAPRKKRGRKSAADKAADSEASLAKAIELIRTAGKSGIKAIKLAHELRRAGHGKVGKTDLLKTEQIKKTGTGGGSTYVFAG